MSWNRKTSRKDRKDRKRKVFSFIGHPRVRVNARTLRRRMKRFNNDEHYRGKCTAEIAAIGYRKMFGAARGFMVPTDLLLSVLY